MKKHLLFAFAAAVLALGATVDAFAQRKSGRDGFGYRWLRSDTAGGPTYNWVDITTSGTQVQGMGDDNVVGPIPIGFDFVYYWNTYNEVYIGSNGYIMFGRGDNVASGSFSGRSGMPPYPFAADNKNNMIGPFLADLTFIQDNGSPAPNAGLFYQTIGNQFIVTYKSVPFWNSAGAGSTSGANTFQLILDRTDSSFTIQYQVCSGSADAAYNGNKTSRGFEDINGANGSSFGANSAFTGANGINNKAYKVAYPRTTTFQIRDIAAEGVFNADNGASFLIQGASNNTVSAVVRNSGTVDLDSITVNISVEDAQGNLVANGPINVPTLARGQRTTVSLPALPPATPAGNYLVQVSTSIRQDGVTGNNNIAGETDIVDTTASPTVYGYDAGTYPGTNQNFTAFAFGNYYEFPAYPVKVTGAQFDMGWVSSATTDYQDSSVFRVRFHLPLANGTPGPAIDSATIDFNTQLDGDSIAPLFLQGSEEGIVRRHTLFINTPINITSGGLYVSMQYTGTQPRFFWNRPMADTVAPYSFRTFEIQGGTWGPDRNRDASDNSLRVVTRTSFVANKPIVAVPSVIAFPNPATDVVSLKNPLLKQAKGLSVVDVNGREVMYIKGAQIKNGSVSFSVAGLRAGTYAIRGIGQKSFTSRFVKN